MKTDGELVDRRRMLSIVTRRLAEASPRVRKVFPPILRESPRIFVRTEADYLMVAFLTPSEDLRVKQCLEKRTEPFPGLIARGGEPAAFGVAEGSRNFGLEHNEISNMFAVCLGADSSGWLMDHRQSMTGRDGMGISYTVALAYIVGYGKDIKPSTVYEHFEELVMHSINGWMKSLPS